MQANELCFPLRILGSLRAFLVGVRQLRIGIDIAAQNNRPQHAAPFVEFARRAPHEPAGIPQGAIVARFAK